MALPIRTKVGGKNGQEQETLSRLATILESAVDAVVDDTLEGTIVSWNRGAERIYGYPTNAVIGKPISILCMPDNADEIVEILERLRQGEKVEHYQAGRVTRGGKCFDVSLTISPVMGASGGIIGASTIARDIAEQQEAMEEITRYSDCPAD